jgi:hypothetical protein
MTTESTVYPRPIEAGDVVRYSKLWHNTDQIYGERDIAPGFFAMFYLFFRVSHIYRRT